MYDPIKDGKISKKIFLDNQQGTNDAILIQLFFRKSIKII